MMYKDRRWRKGKEKEADYYIYEREALFEKCTNRKEEVALLGIAFGEK